MFPMEGQGRVNNVSPLAIQTLSFGMITDFSFLPLPLFISDICCSALFLLTPEPKLQRNLSC